MKSCVIFDFDGVIANTETLHLGAYNHAFKILEARVGRNIQITPQQYFSRYIMYGTTEGFGHMLHDAGVAISEDLIQALCEEKDRVIDVHLDELSAPLPGVVRLLEHLKQRRIPCGICSGARRAEITRLLVVFGLLERFSVIVSIEDVRRGKPDPEGYSLAFEKLWELSGAEAEKKHSLVIEDTAGGAAAAHGAGLRVLGVAEGGDLAGVSKWADYSVIDLSHLDMEEFDRWLGTTK